MVHDVIEVRHDPADHRGYTTYPGDWIATCRSSGKRGHTKGEAVGNCLAMMIDNGWGTTALSVIELLSPKRVQIRSRKTLIS